MSVGWSGPDPIAQLDGATQYELGAKYHVNSDVTIGSIRVWSPPSSHSYTARKARVRNAGQTSVLATATLDDVLPSGWTTYSLDSPVAATAGTDVWVTYDVQDTYGVVAPAGFPRDSVDGLVTATGGAFATNPPAAPTNATANFYGIDLVYSAGIGGNQRPVAGVTASAVGLAASAVVTIADESPALCDVLLEWGDGATSAGSGPQTFTHTYTVPGTYAVLVTVTDPLGAVDAAATVLAVYSVPSGEDPNGEQVAVRWLQGVNGITASMVATTLPRDNNTWAASGFVRVDGVVGGEIDAETGYRTSVASLTLWAATPSSGRPPWWKAARLGSRIIADCAPPGRGHRLLTIGTGYRNVRVVGAVPLGDPRRVPSDPGAYARYQMDLSLSWAIV